MGWFSSLAFVLMISLAAQAEHRVFLLQISDKTGAPVRQLKSTLDPDQYRGYHPLNEGESVKYIETWMCKGRTGHVPTCPSPRELAAEAGTDPPSQVIDTPAPPPPPIEAPAVPASPP